MTLDFTPRPGEAFAAAFQAHVDAAIKAKREADDAEYRATSDVTARPGLGAGRLGNECLRAIAYEYHRTPRDPGREPDGKLYRIFDRGHLAEPKMADYLRLAGFTVLTVNREGKQFRYDIAPYEDGKGRVKGMADGIITNGPPFLIDAVGHHKMSYPMGWETKELGAKSWKKYASQGVKKVGGDYYPQMQMGMAYLDLPATLFTAKNADTQEIYAEIVPFDQADAQFYSDKAARIIATQAPEEMPRIAKERTDYRCKFCDFAEKCWNSANLTPGPAEAAPGWLTGA